MSNHFACNLPFGASVLPDGAVRFRFWAPAQDAVAVALEDGTLVPMQRRPDGWFETTIQCPAGTRYRYRLADGVTVPDPASRAQANDVHDPSIVINPHAYCWRNTAWCGRPWAESVIYELHVGALGGFSGVMRELPRLAALGVTAVELMPINDFPGNRNWGYDGVLPFAPDAVYGKPDELKALIDSAHDLGLMVFLDVVYNHFGPDGNYISLYAPQFFRNDRQTPWGATIDFHQPAVREFFTGNVIYWLMEYRFDGLRFDAVHAIEEQDWVDEMAATVRATIEPDRNVHLVLEQHNNATHLMGDVDAQWNDDGHNVLHVLLTGEAGGYYADYADRPAEKLARSLAEGWVYQGEMSRYLGKPRGQPSTALPPSAHVLFLQNHDQIGNRAFGERLTTLVEPAALEAAIALLILCPQIPLLFMGEEMASRTPFLFFTHHGPDLACAVRDGRRAEFAGFAQFADTASRDRIPDPNALETFQASRPTPDPDLADARSELYRTLIALRQQEIVPRLAGARAIGALAIGPKAVVARWSMSDGAILTLASNLNSQPVAFKSSGQRVLFANDTVPPTRLPGHCTVVFMDAPQ